MALWGMVLTNKSHLPEKVDFIEKIFNPERKEQLKREEFEKVVK